MELQALDHVALAVRDVERSARWYADVFGFEHQHPGQWGGTPVFIGTADASIALFPLRNEVPGRQSGRPSILHFAFRTSRAGFQSAQEELKERGVDFEFQDHEISHSIYLRDPDGHEIEITTYEL